MALKHAYYPGMAKVLLVTKRFVKEIVVLIPAAYPQQSPTLLVNLEYQYLYINLSKIVKTNEVFS